MGTVVLLPQDCLRPRSRYKHTSGMIYPPECAARSRRNSPPLGPSQEPGLLPLPSHGPHSLPMNRSRCGSETKHFKGRKFHEQMNRNPPSKVVPRTLPDAPAYKILQRPKHGEAAVDLLTHFVILDGAKAGPVVEQVKNTYVNGPPVGGLDKCIAAQNGVLNMQVNGSILKNRGLDTEIVKVSDDGGSLSQSAAVCKLKEATKYTYGLYTSTSEGRKPSNIKGGVRKPKNVVKDKLHSGRDDLVCSQVPLAPTSSRMSTQPRAAGIVNDVTRNSAIVQHAEERDAILSGLARLRRASTEPQMQTHILDQYRSKLMNISFSGSNLGPHAHSHEFLNNTVSLSCQERWAGPAYTSSPSPSSLPLPKRCLPHSRFSSLELPPLVKQYSTSVYMQPFLGSSAPTFVASDNGGAWDAAFVTKSLRKMLNLDPC